MKKILLLIIIVLCLYSVNAALTDNINVYWKLDDDGSESEQGRVADSVGNWIGRRINTKVNASGIINTCYNFTDGDYFTNTTLSIAQTFTVNFWVNPSIDGSTRTMFDFGNYLISKDTTNHIGVNVEGGGGPQSTNILGSGWQMITVLQNSTSLYIYFNGTIDTMDSPETPFTPGDSYIGRYSGAGQNYVGRLDEIGIWNRTLTDSEITELWNSGSGLAYPFGAESSSDNVTIPEIVSITDTNIKVGNNITLYCNNTNETATITYQFYNTNDTAVKQDYSSNNNYTVLITDAHDIIEARCRATLLGNISSANATNVSIQNTLPGAPTVTYLPASVNTTATVTATGSSTDADGDTLTYIYKFVDSNTSTLLPYSSIDNILINISFNEHTIYIYSISNDGYGNSTAGNTSFIVGLTVTAPPNYGTTTGYSNLAAGNPLLAVYNMYNAIFVGYLVLFLFVVFQILLFIKARSLTSNFVTGLIFAGIVSVYTVVKTTSIHLMFVMLVLEGAGIVVLLFKKGSGE